MLLSSFVGAKDAEIDGRFAHLTQTFDEILVVPAAEQIDVEAVFPWFADNRPRFDAAHVVVAVGEKAQRFQQRAWAVRRFENDDDLVLSSRKLWLATDDDKTGDV